MWQRRNPGRKPESLLEPGLRPSDVYQVRSNNISIQVTPRRIGLLDKIELPFALPALDRLLARNGRFHCLAHLEPDQRMNAIFFREPFHKIALVLPDALNRIGRHADVKSAVSTAGEDVDAGLFHRRRVLDSGVRRNDEPHPVIPGLTRNPAVAPSKRLDSGLRRKDEPHPVIPGLTRNPAVAPSKRLDSGLRRKDEPHPVIPGLTRNPAVAPSKRLDSGLRRKDGGGGLRRTDGDGCGRRREKLCVAVSTGRRRRYGDYQFVALLLVLSGTKVRGISTHMRPCWRIFPA